MSNRVAFLPGSVSAAVAAPLLTVLCALYLLPSMHNRGGGIPVRPPQLWSGEVDFEHPATTLLSLDRNGYGFLAPSIVRHDDLRRFLEEHRGISSFPLEIAADRNLRWRDGYAEIHLFRRLESSATLRA